jgi:SagB-type dehydrogenase family enzyme
MMFKYHQATKHTVESIFRSQHFLNWDTMPDPFRHYDGVPVVDLPADPPPPGMATLDVLNGVVGERAGGGGADSLSQLLFYAASISASKVVPATGYRYALRVNPSSGNLHPTEFHFVTRGLARWEDGLYHYRVSSHMAELRATGDPLPDVAPEAAVVFVLTSIAWREAWKYQSRAYRYCLHDVGHAWQALALSSQACGWRVRAMGEFPDDVVAGALRLTDEWPMLLVALEGEPAGGSKPVAWLDGVPNCLSTETVSYPLIEEIHEASKRKAWRTAVSVDRAVGVETGRGRPFGETVRGRRSALDFVGGDRSIGRDDFEALLAAARRPFGSDFDARLVHLYAWVHRVRGLEAGVYRCDLEAGTVGLVKAGDQRMAVAGLSLNQDLAGNACVAISMIADLQRAFRLHGDRGYRYSLFEAGAIGHRFYLASEALGFRSTGIGAFYDDRVHQYLDIDPSEGQVVYHFACGYAVHDPRLDAR